MAVHTAVRGLSLTPREIFFLVPIEIFFLVPREIFFQVPSVLYQPTIQRDERVKSFRHFKGTLMADGYFLVTIQST